MKITLGAKELENIVGAWATDRYDDGLPSVKIVKKRDSIDVIIDYSNAKVAEQIIVEELVIDPTEEPAIEETAKAEDFTV